jgi:TRAP-type C4-dicarboxylate transport system permease small subunit
MIENFILAYEKLYRRWVPLLIGLPLFIMTAVVFMNAVGRKLLAPFPGTVELVEALLVVSVYFGVALVAQERGHVNVTFATDGLGHRKRYFIEGVGHVLGACAFGYLAVAAWAAAADSVRIWEFRLAVYRFPLWPFKCLFAFGLSLLAFQLVVNAIKDFHFAAGRKAYAGSYSLEP